MSLLFSWTFFLPLLRAGELFTNALFFEDTMYRGETRLVSESCLLTGLSVAATFSRSRFLSPENTIIPTQTPHTTSQWRLTSITCDHHTSPALHPQFDASLLVADVDSCEALLTASLSPESLAFSKTLSLCFPLASASKFHQVATTLQISDPAVLFDVPVFVSEYLRNPLSFSSAAVTSCSQRRSPHGIRLAITRTMNRKMTHRAKFSVTPLEGAVRLQLASLECPGLDIQDGMGFFVASGNERLTCDDRAYLGIVNVEMLCATVEDLRQKVYGMRAPALGTHCFVETRGGGTHLSLAFKPESGGWRVTGLQCGLAMIDESSLTKREVLMNKNEKIASLVERLEGRLNEVRENMGAYGNYEGLQVVGDGGTMDSLSGECMALRTDMFSGLSFNKLCDRKEKIHTFFLYASNVVELLHQNKYGLQLFTETCQLYGSEFSVNFVKSTFVQGRRVVTELTPFSQGIWRVGSVTCGVRTFPILKADTENDHSVYASNCELLLHQSASYASLAAKIVRKVCPENNWNTLNLGSIWELQDQLSCSTVQNDGGVVFRLSKSDGDRHAHVADLLMLRSGKFELDQLHATMGRFKMGASSFERKIQLHFIKVTRTCDSLKAAVNLELLFSTSEDLRARVVGTTGANGVQVCSLTAEGGTTVSFVKAGGLWKFSELMCGGEFVPLRRSAPDESLKNIFRAEAMLNSAKGDERFLPYSGLDANGLGSVNTRRFISGALSTQMPHECMALRIDLFSGLTFNALCERANQLALK